MSRAAALVAVALAVCALLAVVDLHAWDRALERGYPHDALLPGDPVGRAVGAERELRYREAVGAFEVALRTPRGFDNGERRARARSVAEALLAGVATSSSSVRAGQAQNLLGVLAATGRLRAGEHPEARARIAWETAIRTDPASTDAKFNLELLLRRQRASGTREGPEGGSGARGRSRRGAGSGTRGRGY